MKNLIKFSLSIFSLYVGSYIIYLGSIHNGWHTIPTFFTGILIIVFCIICIWIENIRKM